MKSKKKKKKHENSNIDFFILFYDNHQKFVKKGDACLKSWSYWLLKTQNPGDVVFLARVYGVIRWISCPAGKLYSHMNLIQNEGESI